MFIWNIEDRFVSVTVILCEFTLQRYREGAGWVAQVRDRVEAHEKGTLPFRLGLWRQTFSTPEYTSFFHPQEEKEWAYHLLGFDQIVIDSVQSRSYIAVLPPDEKAKVVEDIKAILQRGDGRIWINKEESTYQCPFKTLAVASRKKYLTVKL